MPLCAYSGESSGRTLGLHGRAVIRLGAGRDRFGFEENSADFGVCLADSFFVSVSIERRTLLRQQAMIFPRRRGGSPGVEPAPGLELWLCVLCDTLLPNHLCHRVKEAVSHVDAG